MNRRKRNDRSAAGVPEPARAALRSRQVLHRRPDHLGHSLHDELGDAIPSLHLEGLVGIEVHEQHLQLVPIARVDQAGRVEAGDAVAQGEAAAWLHEPRVALGQGEGDAGRDQGPSAAGLEPRRLPGHEVEAGIAGPRVGGQVEVGIEPHHRDRQLVAHGGEARTRRPGRWPSHPWGYPAAVLVWMDLEMTGLDPSRHVIVEIATIVTDDELEIVAEGPDLVVHQPPEALAEMDEVVRVMHTSSGLLKAIAESTVTLEEAGKLTLDFITEHVPEPRTIPLCGNSIGTDRRFLALHLPAIEEHLHYRSVDVSTDQGAHAPLVSRGPRRGAPQGDRAPRARRHPRVDHGAALVPRARLPRSRRGSGRAAGRRQSQLTVRSR